MAKLGRGLLLAALLLAGCETAMPDASRSCMTGDGCFHSWYQYQMMTINPQTGAVGSGPMPVAPAAPPQPPSVTGSQGGAVK
jgi:hypothetical protein